MKDSKKSKEMKIPPIPTGYVIDHMNVATAFKAGKILRLTDYVESHGNKSIVSAVMNVESKRVPGGRKDILKIENRELDPSEVDKIALLSPYATLNKIRDYKVVEKRKVKLPNHLIDLVKCPNETCISNPKTCEDGSVRKEPIPYRFDVLDNKKPVIRCYYCEKELDRDEIYKNLIF